VRAGRLPGLASVVLADRPAADHLEPVALAGQLYHQLAQRRVVELVHVEDGEGVDGGSQLPHPHPPPIGLEPVFDSE
jgi:hypothetical protein